VIAARRGRAGLVALLVGGAVAGTVAGCTSAVPRNPSPPPSRTHTTRTSAPAPSTTAPTHRPRPSTTAPKPTRTRSSSAPASSSPAPTSAPASTSHAPPAPTSTCTDVGIRVIRGGAEQGTEIAALQFTNDGSASCVLVGYPRAVLLRQGAAIGAPSQPGGPLPGRAMQLRPGQTVQSLLRDFSSCQAPLSDEVRVTVPGSTIHAARPADLRACTLRVGQLTKPS